MMPRAPRPQTFVLEPKVKLIKSSDLDALGVNFEEDHGKGFVDFLLARRKPASRSSFSKPKQRTRIRSSAKEQARKYAKSQNCRFVILSNGNLHYFWDLAQR